MDTAVTKKYLRDYTSSSSSSSSSRVVSLAANTTTTTSTSTTTPLITVALLGPPNAGKSTLFNRLLDKEYNKAYRLATDKNIRGKLSWKQNKKKRKQSTSGRLASSSSSSAGMAIVSDIPGTTRDRRECMGRIGGTYFRLVDTAGVDGERIDTQQSNQLVKSILQQTLAAAQQADLVLLLVDAKVGVTSDLMETVRWLRKVYHHQPKSNETSISPKRIVVLANKLEGTHWDYEGSPVLDHLDEVTRVGFGEAIPISAAHGEGMADLAVVIEQVTREKQQALAELGLGVEDKEDRESNGSQTKDQSIIEKPLQLAILGRQNVGKSTLVNALLQQERVITGPTPGLTRDAIAVEWSWDGRPVQIVDTAGIRKRSQRELENDIEDLAVQDAIRAMKVADVAVLVLDAEARMLQRQELAIANAVLKEGRAIVVVANKMDLILEDEYDKDQFVSDVRRQLESRFPMLRQTPVVAMSSLKGESVQDLMPVVFRARERWARVITTGQLNRWVKEVVTESPPPLGPGGRPVRIKYVLQTKGRPPTFLLFCNVDELPQNYIRYLTRHFQDTFEMFGMEVRLAVKLSASSNPFEPEYKRSGSGLGGRNARMKRMVQNLKLTGSPIQKKKRSRQRTKRW